MYSVMFLFVNIIESSVPLLVSTSGQAAKRQSDATVPSIATDVAHNYCPDVLWARVDGDRRVYHCHWGSIGADF